MKKQTNFFFCPASDYLNQYNETGSHGQISYQFLRHLAKKNSVKNIFGAVIMSLAVAPIKKTHIEVLIKKNTPHPSLNDFDSLYFYLVSFIRFIGSKAYRDADVVHHIIPFSYGRSFNLFFLWKNKKKKYIIGPIIGPHIDSQITADEEYSFTEKKSLQTRISEFIFKTSKAIALGLFSSVLSFLSRKTLQSADIVFFSDNHARNYHKKFMKNNQKAIILDTGIDTDVFIPTTKRTKRNEKQIRVLFVGRLTKRKGCEYLIKAIAEAKKSKAIIHLDILGVGPLREELESLVRDLKITKQVTFLGGVKSNEEIVSNYHATDIVCLPALSETFTVTKEAMASGKPVIVTDVCSNAERVTPDVNGYVVPPKDPSAIADILVSLSKKPKTIDTLSKNALKTRDLYDWNKILDRYLKVIA